MEKGRGGVGLPDGAMVLGKLPVQGRPKNLISVGQGLSALAERASGGCLDIFRTAVFEENVEILS